MTDLPLPPWPEDPPIGGPHAGPGPVLSDDGSHDRLYNPDGFGCGAPLAVAVAVLALLGGAVALLLWAARNGGHW